MRLQLPPPPSNAALLMAARSEMEVALVLACHIKVGSASSAASKNHCVCMGNRGLLLVRRRPERC